MFGTKPRVRFRVEQLEDRLTPSVSPLLSVGLEPVLPNLPLDMTTVAQQFPPHAGPTYLYLNFDGWEHYNQGTFVEEASEGFDGSNSASSFQSTTGNRDSDIQEILFRTSELFAPFNVQVVRRTGEGSHSTSNGNTTVFVGNNNAANGAHGFTENSHVDAPGLRLEPVFIPNSYGGYDIFTVLQPHAPNSNPWDRAFVDPVRGDGTSWANDRIARVVAHEAGHTFGLVHIRTVGVDPAPLGTGTTPEMMSYDSDNLLFANRVFGITAWNNDGDNYHLDGTLPYWQGEDVERQNSYTYLQAVLGARPADDRANVAHPGAVDPAYRDTTLQTITPGMSLTGHVTARGDYDVFGLPSPAASDRVTITVTPSGGDLNPVVMVYQGDALVAFNNDRSATDPGSKITFTRTSGSAYRIVVGSADGATTGTYTLSVAIAPSVRDILVSAATVPASPAAATSPRSTSVAAPTTGRIGLAGGMGARNVEDAIPVAPARQPAVAWAPKAIRVDGLPAPRRSEYQPMAPVERLDSDHSTPDTILEGLGDWLTPKPVTRNERR